MDNEQRARDLAEKLKAEAIALLREHGEYARAGDWCDRRDALLDRIDELAAAPEAKPERTFPTQCPKCAHRFVVVGEDYNKPAPDRCPQCRSTDKRYLGDDCYDTGEGIVIHPWHDEEASDNVFGRE